MSTLTAGGGVGPVTAAAAEEAGGAETDADPDAARAPAFVFEVPEVVWAAATSE
jgi:hypothetical protein